MQRQLNFKFEGVLHSFAVARIQNNFPADDMCHEEETLFLTLDGHWYILGTGGAMSKFAESHDCHISGGSRSEDVTKDQAIAWLKEHNLSLHF